MRRLFSCWGTAVVVTWLVGPGAAHAAGWTIQPVPSPTAPEGQLSAVSCELGTCIAAGSLGKPDGTQATLAESWNGTSWTEQPTPTLPGAAQGALSAVSCVSPTSCLAVGWYAGAGGKAALAESWNGSGWTINPTAPIAGASDTVLTGVSCTPGTGSAIACTAVGYSTTASGHAPLIESWDGSNWTVASAKAPANATDSYLGGVSCTVAAVCTAVGYFVAGDGTGYHTLVERLTSTGWAIVPSPDPSGATSLSLTGVSCTGLLACSAVGYAVTGAGATVPLAEQWNGTSWTLVSAPVPAGAGGDARFTGVTCTSPTSCLAVGHGGVAEQWDGAHWSAQTTATGVIASFAGASCVFNGASTSCTAVGEAQNPLGAHITVAEGSDGSTWTLETTPDTGPAPAVLDGVSCTTGGCTAVGYSVGSAGTQLALAERWNGSSWTIQATPKPTAATASVLQGVSCATDTVCTAVGYSFSASSIASTLALRWNGTSWTIQNTPNVANATVNALAGVSCPGPSLCLAVGHSGDGHTSSSLSVLWNGTSWTVVSTPVVGNDSLAAISCPSPTSCAASGTAAGGSLLLAEAWNGTGWSVQSTTNPSKTSGDQFTGVSCSGASTCTAAGWSASSSAASALAERLVGGTWLVQATPNPAGATSALLQGISCPASTACTAVGDHVAGSSVGTLAERWDGAAWRLQSTPDPAGATLSALSAVSCTSAQTCIAVGNSQQAVIQPLAEAYSGPAPPGNVTPPSESGQTVSGQALSEAHGSWTNAPTAFAYRWERCDAAGASCAVIAGATSQSYTLGAADVGHTLRVEETAFNDGGASPPATSSASPVVQEAPHSVPGPTRGQIKAQLLAQIVPHGHGAKIGQLLAHDGIKISFTALTAGRVVIHWWYRPSRRAKEVLIAAAHGTFAKATRTAIRVRLTQAGRRLLAHSSHLAVQARAAFTPAGAAGVVAIEDFALGR